MNRYNYEPPCSENELKQAYEVEGLSQCECAERFSTTQKRIWRAMKRFGIQARKAVKRNQWGDANHNWKGNKAGKQAFHRRLYSRFGKPNKCSVCGTTKAECYDYANLTGKYEVLEDYAPMCRSCHWKYDDKIQNITGQRRENA